MKMSKKMMKNRENRTGSLKAAVLCLALAAAFSVGALTGSAGAAEIGYLNDTLATDGATYQECTLGDVMADAARTVCGTDLAIMNGGDFGYSLIFGGVTDEDLENTFPVDYELYTVEVTPSQLSAVLEELIAYQTSGGSNEILEEESAFDGYPQISGFTMKYDVSCPEGERIVTLTLDDETELDLDDEETILTLTVTSNMVEGIYADPLEDAEETGYTLRSAFREYLEEEGTLDAPEEDRLTVKGIGGRSIISIIGVGAVFLAAVIIGYWRYSMKRREQRFYSFGG